MPSTTFASSSSPETHYTPHNTHSLAHPARIPTKLHPAPTRPASRSNKLLSPVTPSGTFAIARIIQTRIHTTTGTVTYLCFATIVLDCLRLLKPIELPVLPHTHRMSTSNAAASPLHTHLHQFLTTRQPPKTFCPSEVARALSAEELSASQFGTWRDAMPAVRSLVYRLRDEGACEVLQKGQVVVAAESDVSGPIRVRRVDGGDDEVGLK